eukprot:scaffold3165_cov62-Cyclotella_meneghiniana.AAC.2
MGNPRKNPSESSYEKQFSTLGMPTSTKGFDSCCRSIEFQADALAENDVAKQCACACETMSPNVDDNSDYVNVCKMVKTDNRILTNQPERGAIPPLVSSRVVGCLGVVEKAVFDEKQQAEMDESEYSFSAVSVMAERYRRKWRQR